MASKYLLEVSASQQYLNQSPDFQRQLLENAEQRFKVHGEGRVVAIVGSPAALDSITTCVEAGNTPGTVHTKCIPIVSYESLGKDSLGVTESEIGEKGNTAAFDGEKETYWVQFNVGYGGHTLEDFRKVWHDEALLALRLVYGGKVPISIHKSVFERQVHLFIQIPGAKVDKMPFELPLWKALGSQINTTVRRVTPL